MQINPQIVRSQIEQIKLIYPELAADEEDWLLTLESETDLHKILRAWEHRRRDTMLLTMGLALTITDLKKRLDRLDLRESTIRRMMHTLMDTAGLKKLELPEVTLTISNGSQQVRIIDEQQLPQDYLRTKTEPDRAKIRTSLKNGEQIPGAELSNAEPHITIRTK